MLATLLEKYGQQPGSGTSNNGRIEKAVVTGVRRLRRLAR